MTYTNCPTHGNAPDYGKGCAFCANVETRATLAKGTRVELHPATDEWMQGDRFGEIVGYGRTRDYIARDTREMTRTRPYLVKLDKSGRVRRFHPDNVQVIS